MFADIILNLKGRLKCFKDELTLFLQGSLAKYVVFRGIDCTARGVCRKALKP